MTERVVVTGATGTVGRTVLAELRRSGVAVRALTRSGKPLPLDLSEGSEDGGVEVVPFSFTDPGTWDGAFTGANALFLMRPPQIGNVRRDLLPAVRAARERGITRVAFLSVLGADRNRLLPHHAVEAWLARSGMQYSAIRAGNFMQNLLTVHGADIRDRSELVVPAGDAAMSYVDARDVGAVAARCLLDDLHVGRSYAPTGPAAITHAEIAAALTRELRRPIRYTRPSLPRYWLHARRTDMSAGTVAVTSVLYTLARLGVGSRVTDDVSTVLGRAATTFARFAHDHHAAWC